MNSLSSGTYLGKSYFELSKQNIEKNVIREWDEYLNVNKNKRETERELAVKEKYKEDSQKIFDIAAKDLEESLKKDRLLDDREKPVEKQKEKLEEDLAFLRDQYDARLFSMGAGDIKYTKKKRA